MSAARLQLANSIEHVTSRERNTMSGLVAARNQLYSNVPCALCGILPEKARGGQQSGRNACILRLRNTKQYIYSCSHTVIPLPAQPHLQAIDLPSGRLWAKSARHCLAAFAHAVADGVSVRGSTQARGACKRRQALRAV